jgi:hypothetical protein
VLWIAINQEYNMALSKDCIQIIKKGLIEIKKNRAVKLKSDNDIIDDDYVIRLYERDFDDLDLKLNALGKRVDDPIIENGEPVLDKDGNPLTYKQNFINDIIDNQNSVILDELDSAKLKEIKTLQNLEKIDNLVNFLQERDPFVSRIKDPLSLLPGRQRKARGEAEQVYRAFNALLLNTNDVVGHVPLELLIKNLRSTMIADFQRALDRSDALKGKRFEKWIEDEQNDSDMSDEFYDMNEQFRSDTPQVTKNDQAYQVAKIFFDTVIRPSAADLKIMGRKTGIASKTRLSVRFDFTKTIDEGTRADFQNFMRDKIRKYTVKNGEVEDDVTDIILDVVYDTVRDKEQGWRKVNQNIRNKLRSLHESPAAFAQNYQGKSHLSFIDGAARRQVVNKYSNYSTGALEFMNAILENGRERALTQFFGPEYEGVYGSIKASLTKGGQEGLGPLGNDFDSLTNVQKKVARSVAGYVESQYINPAYGETDRFASIMSALRNVQNIGKLGSASITSILDVPTFSYTGKRLFGLDVDELIAGFTRTNKYKGTPEEIEYHRRLTLDAMNGLMNNVGQRFGAVDSLGAYSKFEKGSAAYANYIFKLSGLTLWTESLQGAAANVYARSLGTHITKGVKWNDLNDNFRSQLKRYGMTEQDWQFVLRNKPLNDEGLFDMNILRSLEDGDASNRTVRLRMGTDSIYEKFQATMRDAVDTMVIKPGDFDILATSFFPAEFAGPGTQIAKMFSQFKTHPITYYRKVISRRFLNNRLGDAYANAPNRELVEKVADLAVITGMMVMTGALVTQLKQVISGKQGYTWDSPTLWARAATTSGAFGILSDMFLTIGGGEDIIASIISPRKEPIRTTAEKFELLLGPMIVDIAKLLDNTQKLTIGSIRDAKNLDEGELVDKGFSNLTKFVLDTAGFKNLVLTKALYRIFVTEYLTEWMDPDGYYRTQRRLDTEAFEERIGGKKNITQIQDIVSTLTFGAVDQ